MLPRLFTYQLTFPHSPQDRLSSILISQLLHCERVGQCRKRDSRHVASFYGNSFGFLYVS